MAIITLKSWFQLDFDLPNALVAKKVILNINDLMEELKTLHLVSDWFFLYEGNTVRVRMKSKNKKALGEKLKLLSRSKGLKQSNKLPFSHYQEGDEMMFNAAFVERFAAIMSEITQLTIEKMREDITFDNYRALERIQHCMFNNLATLSFKSEEHFLKQRLLERTRQPLDNNFENKL